MVNALFFLIRLPIFAIAIAAVILWFPFELVLSILQLIAIGIVNLLVFSLGF